MHRPHTGLPAAATVAGAPAGQECSRTLGPSRRRRQAAGATTAGGGSTGGGGWPPRAPWGAWPLCQSSWAAPLLLIRRARARAGPELLRGAGAALGSCPPAQQIEMAIRRRAAPAPRPPGAPLQPTEAWGTPGRAVQLHRTLGERRQCWDAIHVRAVLAACRPLPPPPSMPLNRRRTARAVPSAAASPNHSREKCIQPTTV